MSNRRETRKAAQDFIDNLKPLRRPNSEKIFIEGSRPDIQVGMRQIHQTDTRIVNTRGEETFEANPPIKVYDCAGPYSDPEAEINVRHGLPKLREGWILARCDTEELNSASSNFTQQRLADEGLDHLRLTCCQSRAAPRLASGSPSCTMPVRVLSPRRWNTSPFVRTWPAMK